VEMTNSDTDVAVFDLPIDEYDPLYCIDLRCDGMVRWTWKTMIRKTEPYCEYRDYYCEQLHVNINGWWMSKRALDNLMLYEWPQ